MQLNKYFAKLKLSTKIKEIYNQESSSRRKTAGMSVDDQIYSCYRGFISGNYTYSWCNTAENLVKLMAGVDKAVLDKVTRYKEYLEIKNSYQNIKNALDFITSINTISDKYAILATSYEKISKDALLECYEKLYQNQTDVTKIKTFIDQLSTASAKATPEALKYLQKNQLDQYHNLVTLSKNLSVVITKFSQAKAGIAFKTEIEETYKTYINSVNACMVELNKSDVDLFKALRKDPSLDKKMTDFCTKMTTLVQSAPKVDFTYINQASQKHYSELVEKYNRLSSKLPNKKLGAQGIDIYYEIERMANDVLKQAKALQSEYEKNPKAYCERGIRKINNREIEKLIIDAMGISKKINKTNQAYITNKNVLDDLIKTLQKVYTIEKIIPYYQFIFKTYPSQIDFEEKNKGFKDLEHRLQISPIENVKFPFEDEWTKIKREMLDYDKKKAAKERKKIAAARSRRGFLMFITFPFRLIFKLISLIFIGIGKVFKGIGWLFVQMIDNDGLKVIFTTIISAAILVLTFLKILKIPYSSSAYLVMTAITTGIVSIISLVGGFKNNDEANGVQIILNMVQPVLPLVLLFLGNIFKINILMLVVSSIGMILTSTAFTRDESSCDGSGYYVYVIFSNLVTVLMLFIHGVMQNLCNAKAMYVFFYIFMIAMEIYLIYMTFHQGYYDFDYTSAMVLYFIGAIVMICAFLFFALAARSKSFLWAAIPSVIIALVLELWGFAIEVDE